tara:strand:+ start:2120 stop:2554 length:435 start_codon:yes stop_codon:yes gene_type:complete
MNEKMLNTMFSSKTDLWETPVDFFTELDKEFQFTLDVCANEENAKCLNYYDINDDGLSKNWIGNIWCNPPYGRDILNWVKKASEEIEKDYCNKIVMLVPSRTDTNWWHKYVINEEVRFIKGRLKFGGHRNSAPFPSAVVVYKRA